MTTLFYTLSFIVFVVLFYALHYLVTYKDEKTSVSFMCRLDSVKSIKKDDNTLDELLTDANHLPTYEFSDTMVKLWVRWNIPKKLKEPSQIETL